MLVKLKIFKYCLFEMTSNTICNRFEESSKYGEKLMNRIKNNEIMYFESDEEQIKNPICSNFKYISSLCNASARLEQAFKELFKAIVTEFKRMIKWR